jgi:hypothetical protein
MEIWTACRPSLPPGATACPLVRDIHVVTREFCRAAAVPGSQWQLERADVPVQAWRAGPGTAPAATGRAAAAWTQPNADLLLPGAPGRGAARPGSESVLVPGSYEKVAAEVAA